MMSFIWKLKQKQRYKLIKIIKLTLQNYGNGQALKICDYLKLPFQKPPLKILFYKDIATNDDYINNYCLPNQTEFSDECFMWYLHIKTKIVTECKKLLFENSR